MLAEIDLKLEQRLRDAQMIDTQLEELQARRLDANGDYAALVDESVALVQRRCLLQADIDELLRRREVAFVEELRRRCREAQAVNARLVTEQLRPRASERDAIDEELRVMHNTGKHDPARREALMSRRAALQSQLIEVSREVMITGTQAKRLAEELEEAERELAFSQAPARVHEAKV